ncbi:hypothetical protein [Donghicola sp. XS_ASV15]|uniref:DUF6985 domain-containing protein n=1 Tax=Donghicola sp. XS_ASV15 TaxID=3241295 RepID=UPI0035124D7F
MAHSALQFVAANPLASTFPLVPAVVRVPFLNDDILPVKGYFESGSCERAVVAIRNFENSSAGLIERIQEYMWRAARDFAVEYGSPGDTLADHIAKEAQVSGKRWGLTGPTGPKDIMSYVSLTEVHLMCATGPDGSERIMISVTGECAWDAEFGVAILLDDAGCLITAGNA